MLLQKYINALNEFIIAYTALRQVYTSLPAINASNFQKLTTSKYFDRLYQSTQYTPPTASWQQMCCAYRNFAKKRDAMQSKMQAFNIQRSKLKSLVYFSEGRFYAK